MALLGPETLFDRLYQYKVGNAITGREEMLDGLLATPPREGDAMKRERVEQIAGAVLYEGYLLYPYRLSSVKNQRRFNFGVLTPPAYSAVKRARKIGHANGMPGARGAQTCLDVIVRFLRVTGSEGACLKAIGVNCTSPCTCSRVSGRSPRRRIFVRRRGRDNRR